MRVQGHARVPLGQPLPEDGGLRPLQVPHERPGPRRAHGVATAPDPPGRRSQAAPVGAECQVRELPAPFLGPSGLRVQWGQRLGVQQGDRPSGRCGHHDREGPAVGAEPGLAAHPGWPRVVPGLVLREQCPGRELVEPHMVQDVVGRNGAAVGLTSSWRTCGAGHLRRRDQLRMSSQHREQAAPGLGRVVEPHSRHGEQHGLVDVVGGQARAPARRASATVPAATAAAAWSSAVSLCSTARAPATTATRSTTAPPARTTLSRRISRAWARARSSAARCSDCSFAPLPRGRRPRCR